MNQFLSLSIYCSGSSSRVCYRDSSKYVKCLFQVLNTGIRVWEPWPTCLVRHSPSKHIVTQSSLIYEINVSFFDFWSCSNCRIIWQTTWWPLLLLSFFLSEVTIITEFMLLLHFSWLHRQGSPRKRKGPISGTRGTDRFRSEEAFYVNPLPDCLCHKASFTLNTSVMIQ